MAPVIESKGTYGAVTTGDLTLTLPASIAANDIIIVQIVLWAPDTTGSIGTFSTPSGWTKYCDIGYMPDTEYDGRYAIFWKRAAGGETSITVTRPSPCDTGSDTAFAGQSWRISGCETSGDPWDGIDYNMGPTTTVTFDAVTVSGSGRTLVALVGASDNGKPASAPTNYTLFSTEDSLTGTDSCAACSYYSDQSSDGSVTQTLSALNQGFWGSVHISFKPVAETVAYDDRYVSLNVEQVAASDRNLSTTVEQTVDVDRNLSLTSEIEVLVDRALIVDMDYESSLDRYLSINMEYEGIVDRNLSLESELTASSDRNLLASIETVGTDYSDRDVSLLVEPTVDSDRALILTSELEGDTDRYLTTNIALESLSDRNLSLETELIDYTDRSLSLSVVEEGLVDRYLSLNIIYQNSSDRYLQTIVKVEAESDRNLIANIEEFHVLNDREFILQIRQTSYNDKYIIVDSELTDENDRCLTLRIGENDSDRSFKVNVYNQYEPLQPQISRGTLTAATTGNLAPQLPSGIVQNDIILIAVMLWAPNTVGDVMPITAPSGYSSLIQVPWYNVSEEIDGRFAVFWKRAVGGESSAIVNRPSGCDTGTDTCFAAQSYRITDVKPTEPAWDAYVYSGPTASTTVTYPAVTVSGSNRTLLAMQIISDNVATATPPSGYTVVGAADNTTTGTDAGFAVYYKAGVSSDGEVSNTVVAQAQGGWFSVHISFAPGEGLSYLDRHLSLSTEKTTTNDRYISLDVIQHLSDRGVKVDVENSREITSSVNLRPDISLPYVFKDDFEFASLPGNWSSSHGAFTQSLDTTVFHHNTKSLKQVGGGTASYYGETNKTVAAATSLYMRTYIMVGTLGDKEITVWFGPAFTSSSDANIVGAGMRRLGGIRNWCLINGISSAVYHVAPEAASPIEANRWYCVEIYAYIHATAGIFRMWVDGKQVIQISGIATNGRGNIEKAACITYMQFGAYHSTNVNWWYDCAEVSTNYIGPAEPSKNVVVLYPDSSKDYPAIADRYLSMQLGAPTDSDRYLSLYVTKSTMSDRNLSLTVKFPGTSDRNVSLTMEKATTGDRYLSTSIDKGSEVDRYLSLSMVYRNTFDRYLLLQSELTASSDRYVSLTMELEALVDRYLSTTIKQTVMVDRYLSTDIDYTNSSDRNLSADIEPYTFVGYEHRNLSLEVEQTVDTDRNLTVNVELEAIVDRYLSMVSELTGYTDRNLILAAELPNLSDREFFLQVRQTTMDDRYLSMYAMIPAFSDRYLSASIEPTVLDDRYVALTVRFTSEIDRYLALNIETFVASDRMLRLSMNLGTVSDRYLSATVATAGVPSDRYIVVNAESTLENDRYISLVAAVPHFSDRDFRIAVDLVQENDRYLLLDAVLSSVSDRYFSIDTALGTESDRELILTTELESYSDRILVSNIALLEQNDRFLSLAVLQTIGSDRSLSLNVDVPFQDSDKYLSLFTEALSHADRYLSVNAEIFLYVDRNCVLDILYSATSDRELKLDVIREAESDRSVILSISGLSDRNVVLDTEKGVSSDRSLILSTEIAYSLVSRHFTMAVEQIRTRSYLPLKVKVKG